MSAEAATEAPAVVLDTKRVFFGNIAFDTTEEQLIEFIKPVGATASKIEFPLRMGRPGGFAFASFETDDDAQKVVDQLAGLTLNERPVSTAIAKSEGDRKKDRAEKIAAQKARRAAQKAENPDAEAATDSAVAVGADGEVKPKKKRSSKKKSARRLPEESEDAPEGAAATGEDGEAPAPRAKRVRKPRAPKVDGAEEARIDDELGGETAKPKAAKREPKERKPRTELSGEPSKTLLFVANLPFSVDDAALGEIFTSHGIAITSSRVVRIRPYGKSKALPRSKGFGFVEVAGEAEQQQALEKLQGFVVEERELAIKIANERVEVPEEAAEEVVGEAAA